MPWISNPGSDRAVTCQRVNFRLEPDRVGASRRSVAEQRGDGRELSLRRPQRRLFYLEAAALLAGCPVNEAIPSPLTVARAELLYCALRRIPTTYHDVQTRSDRGVGRGQVSVRQALLLEPRPFCVREARRLGERKLKEWPELFTDDVLKFIAPRKDVCVSANFCIASVTVVVGCSLGSLFSSRFARSPSGVTWSPGGRSPRPRCHFLLGLHHLTLCQTGVRPFVIRIEGMSVPRAPQPQ